MQYQLQRHGKPDLVFHGVMLARVQDMPASAAAPAEQPAAPGNWWELALYRTSVGAYLLSSSFHVVEEGLRTMATVLSFSTLDTLREYFDAQGRELSRLAQDMLRQAAGRDRELETVLHGAPRRRPALIAPARRGREMVSA